MRSTPVVSVQGPTGRGHEREPRISSDDELSPTDQPAKRKPGAITPLGIRHDKSKGPLGLQTASTTLEEMDTALARLHSWRSRHGQRMAALRKEQHGSIDDSESGHQFTTSDESRIDQKSPIKRPQSAAPGICLEPRSGTVGTPSISMVPSWQDKGLILTERPSTARPSSSGQPGNFSSRTSAKLRPDELDLLRHSMNLDFRPPTSGRGEEAGLQDSRPTPGRVSASCGETSSSTRADMPLTASKINKAHQEGRHAIVQSPDLHPAGSRLMAELEAELAELDHGFSGNELITWESELEDVLAKMDTLQTGYQANCARK